MTSHSLTIVLVIWRSCDPLSGPVRTSGMFCPMRRLPFLILALVLGVAGCSSDRDTAVVDWELMNSLNGLAQGFEDWEQTANWQGIQPGLGNHGPYVAVFWNDVAYAHYAAQSGGDMPEGALIVKQGYADPGGASKGNRTAMWKVDGAWFWALWSGSSQAGGQLGQCLACHNGAPQDSMFTETW